jgi:hypothetical protein
MYHKYNFTLKKITLTFETNDDHQAKSYQNALQCNNQIKVAGKNK